MNRTAAKLILLVLLAQSTAFGWIELDLERTRIPESLQQLSDIDQFAYQTVTDICQSDDFINEIGLKLFLPNQTQTRMMIATLNVEHLRARYKMGGLSPHLNALLSSSGYYLGLSKCFGRDQMKKDLFTAAIISSDLLSDVTGLSQGALVHVGFYKLIKKLPKSLQSKIQYGAYALMGGFAINDLHEKWSQRQIAAEGKEQLEIQLVNDFQELCELSKIESADQERIENVQSLLAEQATGIGLQLHCED